MGLLKVVLPTLGFFQIVLAFLYNDAKFQDLVRQTLDSHASLPRKRIRTEVCSELSSGSVLEAKLLFVNGAISLHTLPPGVFF